MRSNNNNNKSKGFAGVLVLVLIALLAFLGYLYLTKVKTVSPTNSNSNPVASNTDSNPNIVKTADGAQRVTFSYTVKSISPSTIVITGKMGDMTLPNDPSAIQLFNGPTKDSPKLELTALKVGDNVNLEFVLGKSASLFLSTM